MRAHLLLAIALLGCEVPGAPAGADLGPEGPARDVEGRIVALDQQPLPGVAVSLCQLSCLEATTGARGEFSFAGVTSGFYTLRARKPGAGDYADLDFPLYLQSGANPRLLPLVLPRVGEGAPVAPGEHLFPIDDKLSLSLDGGALALPGGGPAGRLGGVRIPQGLYPDFCVPSARVLAMWAFSPTGVTSTSPVGVTLAESLDLAPGAVVSFIEIDPKDGRPGVAASGVVLRQGLIQTSPGAGLRRLGWLLLAVLQGGA